MIERLKGLGLTITSLDLKPFLDHADKVYAGSDLAKAWNQDLMKQTIATAEDRARPVSPRSRQSRRCRLHGGLRGGVLAVPRRHFCRYVLVRPLAWSDELILVIFLWTVF